MEQDTNREESGRAGGRGRLGRREKGTSERESRADTERWTEPLGHLEG